MTRLIPHVVAVIVALAATCAQARFIYTETNATEVASGKDGKGTLTDGIWLLGAVRTKNTNNLNVNGAKGDFLGSKPSPLNLTEIYSEDGETRYYAVSYETLSHYRGAAYSTLYDYKDMITEFVAPDCHQTKGSGCFQYCTALTNVQLNAYVTAIGGDRAFNGCQNLVAFYPRTLNLKSVVIGTFAGCVKLTGSFNLPDCTSMAESVFANCVALEDISAPLITLISASSFSGCSALTNVVFSESLNTIQTSAFKDCSSLPGDVIRSMLSPGLIKLGSNLTDVKYIFTGCTSFDGELVWNFPLLGTGVDNKGNPTSTNVVGMSLFQGCTSLSKVTFKTDVFEIRGSAFKNLAPAAEMHMQASVPSIAAQALGNTAGPFPLVYLRDNTEGWITALEPSYHVMLKADFNNRGWSEMAGTSTRTRDNVVRRMVEDTLMCSQDATTGDVSVSRKNVLAFCMRRYQGSNYFKDYVCFWLLREPSTGTRIMVQ